MLVLAKIDSTYKKNILAEAIKKPRLFIRFASIYPADWMQVFLYSLFIARGAENNTVREERHRIPHDDIWNQKCFTGSTQSGPDMFPTWNRTKWSSRYTTCRILVFQQTLDKFLICHIIQIYSKTLKPEENNKKQKITTETCDGRHICSCYNCEVLGKRQNKTCGERIFYIHRTNDPQIQRSIEPWNHRTNDPSNQRTNDPSNQRSIEPTIHRTSEPTIHRTSEPSNQRSIEPTIHGTNETSDQRSIEPTIHRASEPSNHRTSEPSIQRRIQEPKDPTIHGNITSDPIYQL